MDQLRCSHSDPRVNTNRKRKNNAAKPGWQTRTRGSSHPTWELSRNTRHQQWRWTKFASVEPNWRRLACEGLRHSQTPSTHQLRNNLQNTPENNLRLCEFLFLLNNNDTYNLLISLIFHEIVGIEKYNKISFFAKKKHSSRFNINFFFLINLWLSK